MGKECMARLSRRLWGGTSLKTAAKEANLGHTATKVRRVNYPSHKHKISKEGFLQTYGIKGATSVASFAQR